MICKAHWEFGSLELDHPMHGWLFKKSTRKPSPETGNQDGTQWVWQQYGSTPLVMSERKPIINTVQPYLTQSEKRKKASMTQTILLSSGSQQLAHPLGDHRAIIGKTARDQVQSYSFVPTTTWLELVDAIRFVPWGAEDIRSLGGVSCVSRSPLKE